MDAEVLVGSKPVASYVLAALSVLNHGNTVVLKARGRAISRAVDVAEVLRRRYVLGLAPKSIGIGTEELQRDGGDRISVSTIEIVLEK